MEDDGKICKGCLKLKPLCDYGVTDKKSGRLRSECKQCQSKKAKFREKKLNKEKQMQVIVGVGRVNTILKFDEGLTAKALDVFLKKQGVEPIGKDFQGIKWSQSDIEGVRAKMDAEEKKKQAIPEQKEVVLPSAKNTPDILEEVARFKRLAICELHEISEGVGVVKKQGQEAIKMLMLESGNKGTSSNDHSEKIIEEIAGFIGSFMADQQRIITQQIDSGLESIDSKLDQISKTLMGQGRVIGEVKQSVAEVNRQQQSLLSNVYTTQKATREEILKQMARNEQALDQLREEIIPPLKRVDSAAHRLAK